MDGEGNASYSYILIHWGATNALQRHCLRRVMQRGLRRSGGGIGGGGVGGGGGGGIGGGGGGGGVIGGGVIGGGGGVGVGGGRGRGRGVIGGGGVVASSMMPIALTAPTPAPTSISDAISTNTRRTRIIEILTLRDGADAVELFAATPEAGHSIHLILMDFVMVNMDGPDATSILRNRFGYGGAIVGVTGNVLEEDVAKFLNAGADFVLPKPLDIAALIEWMRQCNCLMEI